MTNTKNSNGKSNFDFVEEMGKFGYVVTMSSRTFGEIQLLAQQLDRIQAEIAAAKAETASLFEEFESILEAMNSPVIPANHKSNVDCLDQ